MNPDGPKTVPPIVPLAAAIDVMALRDLADTCPKLAVIDPVAVINAQFILLVTFKEPPVAILPIDDIVPADVIFPEALISPPVVIKFTADKAPTKSCPDALIEEAYK